MNDKLRAALQKVKAVFMDVDGILTDGSVYIGADGHEFKRFTVEDGVGSALAHQAQLKLAMISGRHSDATTERARQMRIEEVYQGSPNKVRPLEELLQKFGLRAEEVVYVGDGLIDLAVLKVVGVPVTVPNAHPLVKKEVVHITERSGGEGVLREVVEWILIAQGRYDDVITAMGERISREG